MKSDIKRGNPAKYLSISGFICDAVIVNINSNGTVDIDVSTGAKRPLHLTKIKIVEGNPIDPGTCSYEPIK